MSTFMAKPGQLPQRWHLIDATDQVVGRLAVQIANILRGKHRPDYTPHVDTGDFVVVINAEKVRFTGNKWETQVYQSYSHYPGGLKADPLSFNIWIELPSLWNRAAFVEHMRSTGIGVVASDAFTTDGAPPEAVRVCLGGPITRPDPLDERQ